MEGDNPRWAGDADIVFRAQDGPKTLFFRATDDGAGLRKLAATSGVGSTVGSASADGQWLSGISAPENTAARQDGPSPSIYAFSRETVTRNLYRIPLP